MDYKYSSSLVDTSLDLTIGVSRIRVQEEYPTRNALVEELKRVSGENKKLTEMLTLMCDKYNVLKKQLMEHVNNKSNIDQTSPPKKRKSPARNETISSAIIGAGGVSESSSTNQQDHDDQYYLCKKQQREETHVVVNDKTSRVYYKTEASNTTTFGVKDGYQWRKYGQKVTRDNPSPRAYFKCASAPSCSVKKKVQRSVEDQSVLVATYEGEHNHPMPSESSNGLNRNISLGGSAQPSAAANISSSSLTEPVNVVDLTESKKAMSPTSRMDFQKLLVEQMASSLTKDPKFTSALAAAVTGRLHQQNQTDK